MYHNLHVKSYKKRKHQGVHHTYFSLKGCFLNRKPNQCCLSLSFRSLSKLHQNGEPRQASLSLPFLLRLAFEQTID